MFLAAPGKHTLLPVRLTGKLKNLEISFLWKQPEIKKLFDLPRPRISSNSELELVDEQMDDLESSESVVAE
jgi:hypothetical protein